MTEKLQVYKCEVCGNMASMVHSGAGALVCCGAPMKLMLENTVDAAKEKHVPVIQKTAAGFKIKVGKRRPYPCSRTTTSNGSRSLPTAKPTANS